MGEGLGPLTVGRISSPRFIGRAAELEALEGLLARAASGSGGALLVAGEAGIGKSRLVAELEARARGLDALVLLGECVELAEGELAFSPIISALRGVVEDGETLEGLSDPLRGALAALWSLPGVESGVAGGREQLFEAVYRVLARSPCVPGSRRASRSDCRRCHLSAGRVAQGSSAASVCCRAGALGTGATGGAPAARAIRGRRAVAGDRRLRP